LVLGSSEPAAAASRRAAELLVPAPLPFIPPVPYFGVWLLVDFDAHGILESNADASPEILPK
jgi:hypothetical protein